MKKICEQCRKIHSENFNECKNCGKELKEISAIGGKDDADFFKRYQKEVSQKTYSSHILSAGNGMSENEYVSYPVSAVGWIDYLKIINWIMFIVVTLGVGIFLGNTMGDWNAFSVGGFFLGLIIGAIIGSMQIVVGMIYANIAENMHVAASNLAEMNEDNKRERRKELEKKEDMHLKR